MSSDITGQVIGAIRLSPNPIDAGGAFLVSVTVKETTSRIYTLSAASWTGTGPFTQTLTVASDITPTGEQVIYGDHAMTIEQRMQEYDGILRASVPQAGRVKVVALGQRPDRDIPLRIVSGAVPTAAETTVRVSSWTGDGPWTATIGAGRVMRTAACGPASGCTASSAQEFAACGIHVCETSGATVTLRAMLAKPSTDIKVGVMGL